ncbi:MAG: T9SS type A sorting domain-containing protein [Flavobacteriales bacterium]|nr:T9SS type A sorting domain-containing protein [Flavobacteriales bacterium]
MATAFATTPHYIDSDCGTEQTMLFSRVLHPQCITPATVGMTEELSAPARIWPNPVTDELRIQLPNASSWQATCFDALGRAVLHDIVQAQDRIATAALPNGTYRSSCVQLTEAPLAHASWSRGEPRYRRRAGTGLTCAPHVRPCAFVS